MKYWYIFFIIIVPQIVFCSSWDLNHPKWDLSVLPTQEQSVVNQMQTLNDLLNIFCQISSDQIVLAIGGALLPIYTKYDSIALKGNLWQEEIAVTIKSKDNEMGLTIGYLDELREKCDNFLKNFPAVKPFDFCHHPTFSPWKIIITTTVEYRRLKILKKVVNAFYAETAVLSDCPDPDYKNTKTRIVTIQKLLELISIKREAKNDKEFHGFLTECFEHCSLDTISTLKTSYLDSLKAFLEKLLPLKKIIEGKADSEDSTFGGESDDEEGFLVEKFDVKKFDFPATIFSKKEEILPVESIINSEKLAALTFKPLNDLIKELKFIYEDFFQSDAVKIDVKEKLTTLHGSLIEANIIVGGYGLSDGLSQSMTNLKDKISKVLNFNSDELERGIAEFNRSFEQWTKNYHLKDLYHECNRLKDEYYKKALAERLKKRNGGIIPPEFNSSVDTTDKNVSPVAVKEILIPDEKGNDPKWLSQIWKQIRMPLLVVTLFGLSIIAAYRCLKHCLPKILIQ
jgi:hypothetical protein